MMPQFTAAQSLPTLIVWRSGDFAEEGELVYIGSLSFMASRSCSSPGSMTVCVYFENYPFLKLFHCSMTNTWFIGYM
ncbi:hypothetical protein U6A24_02180 [Aquimarina gracilis]|uniref:Uncharacterized protein n=1 Tax=Aquimarina gracilis TaxID=874422 RepID=A0ABU5ZQ94_9FLAO|nr:hypothetical protein [Aquimarina gracilis]MEB3344246.1 hypothetical protein [Aquimarina gracilis]